jgi:hypothetical protein
MEQRRSDVSQPARLRNHIIINKGNYFSAGGANPSITSSREALARFKYIAESLGMLSTVTLCNLASVIGRVIVDDNNFPPDGLREKLRSKAIERRSKARAPIAGA